MIDIAIIGAGVMGAHYARVLDDCRDARLRAIADLDARRAESLARTYEVPAAHVDYEAMLADEQLDAVVVATPDFAHREPVEACLDAGKHVLCEKPLATTREDCAAIAAAVQRAGKNLMVSYGNRHRPNAQRIKETLATRELGDLKHVAIRLNEKLSKTRTISWLDKTSPVWFLLSHCVDTVRWLADREFVEVYATATYGVVEKRLGAHTPDSVSAVATLEGGLTASLESAWILPDSYPSNVQFTLQIIGERGCIESDLFPRDLLVSVDEARIVDYSFDVPGPLGKVQGWWAESVRYFVDCLEAGARPSPGVRSGWAATEVLLALDESIARGAPVRVEPLP
ncbi:MAG: Gfo/Idh/MocA family protein [Armatimonadota bacterium]